MHESSVFWLRVAAFLYLFGLIDAVNTLLRRRNTLFRFALPAFVIAAILHLVAIVELARAEKHLPIANFYQSITVCAFLIALAFLFVWWRYQFSGLSVIVFPLVFLMTLVGAMELPVAGWSSYRLRDGWLFAHVLAILLGYAALLLAAGASIFYLVRERQLKSKRPGALFDHLPPLATLDSLITRSLNTAFLLITVGVVAGITWAFIESGTRWVRDARIHVALVTWGLALAAVFLRNMAGWRGRRAAVLSIALTGCAALTWAAHVGLRSLLLAP